MNIRRLIPVLAAPLLAVAVSCGGGDSSTNVTGIVQLVNVTTNALIISCGNLNFLSNPDTLYMNAHMVNTSATEVQIDSIGSVGYVITASDQAVVGQGALNFTSIPYHPRPATLMARTGDLTVTASVATVSLCAPSSIHVTYKDISTSIRITTSVGQYVSVPITIHVNFVGGLGG